MIGLDTNVVVRYVVQDDPQQSALASATIDALTEAEPGFVSLVTVVELYWVLRRAYGVDPDGCADVIDGLLDSREIRVGQESVVRVASTASRGGADFADALIAELGVGAGCRATVTFDRRAAAAELMELL